MNYTNKIEILAQELNIDFSLAMDIDYFRSTSFYSKELENEMIQLWRPEIQEYNLESFDDLKNHLETLKMTNKIKNEKN